MEPNHLDGIWSKVGGAVIGLHGTPLAYTWNFRVLEKCYRLGIRGPIGPTEKNSLFVI